MSTTRYKIRLWEYDGEASVANAVTFDSFAEAEARFNDLRVSEEMPCVEFIKERIANGCIISDEVLNVRQFASVFDAITKDKPTLAGFLRSLPCIEAPWDAAFQKRYCSSCTAENCDACANEQFRNNPEWWLSLPAAEVEQRRRRAMLRRRVALTVALLTVAALLAALMPWSGSGATDKPKDTTAGTLEEVHQPTAVLLPSSGTVAEYVPNAAEVEALAKLIYGEAGIVPSTTEQAAVVWCVLNRVDDPRFPDTVLEVIEAPYQFSGYDPEYPVKEEFALLAADVLTRYRAERDGEENVGRVLPAEYCFFTGDGRRNHFTTEWKSTDCFGWTLESPYTD